MRYDILGSLRVTTDAGDPVSIGGARQRALLALLALTPGRPVSVDSLLSGQYEEDPPAAARNAIQAQISRLRRSLPAGAISLEHDHYRLNAAPDEVDASRFEHLLVAGRQRLDAGDPADAARLLRTALELWRGPALADVPSAAAAVARLEELHLQVAEDLAEAELALPSGTSISELRQLIAAHPLRERLRGLLMRALAAAGRPAEALTEYERVRTLLADELGTDPSPELSAIQVAILRAEQPSPRRRPPHQTTSFVGREEELQTLAESADRPLVSIVGPGGVGKTRLAIEAVRRGTDPVAFVDLSAIGGDRQVVGAVLIALGRRDPDGAGADPVERLAASLAAESLTILLDNCEHVRDAVAQLCRAVLQRCPGIRLLTTSRVPLGLAEELVITVSGLDVSADNCGNDVPVSAGAAVRLFCDRARTNSGRAVEEMDRAAVAAICSALDGLPLAIELASARVRQFSITELARRLVDDGRLRLLRGDPTATVRHRTLDAVVEWSWQLLTQDQQLLARRLAVFAGGADLASIESVCNLADADLLLADLVDHSLVEHVAGAIPGQQRYRMLGTVTSFCAQRLQEDPDEERDVRRRHAEHFLQLADEADPHLRRIEQLEWLERLAVEDGNLTAALAWAVDHDRPIAMRMISGLAAYWWLSGRSGRSGQYAAQLLHHPVALLDQEIDSGLDEEYVSCVVHAVPRALDDHWERASAALSARAAPLRHPFGAALWGMTYGPGPDPQVAQTLLGNDSWSLALGRLSTVLLGLLGGRPEREEPEMQSALIAFRTLGDRWGTAQVLDWLGVLTSWRGGWERAHTMWDEALELQRRLGAAEECASILCHQAESMIREGRPDEAAATARRAVEWLRRTGRPEDAWAQFQISFADIARLRGEYDQADRLIRQAAAAAEAGTLDAPWMAARIRTVLGRLAAVRGNLDEAAGQHGAAIRLAAAAPFASELAGALEGSAGTAAADGRPKRAAWLLGAAVSLRGLAIRGDRDVEVTSVSATQSLGPETFGAAYAEAAALTPDAVRSIVLTEQ